MPPKTTNELNPLVVLAGFALFALVLRGCGQQSPGPDPAPHVDAAETFEDYRELMSQAWSEGADQLDAGQLDTDRAALEFIKGRAELARQAAFQPVYDRQQQAVADGWTPEKMAAVWRQLATECQ